jgi:hypothetical protein
MRTPLPLKRLLALLAGLAVVAVAHASDDPPGRVARLNDFDGSVTFAPAGSDQWAYADWNRPFTTGDKLWSDHRSRAELHAGSTALRVGADTSVQFLALSDETLQLQLNQGTLGAHVRNLWDNQTVEIDTPNLALVLGQAGEVRIDVDPQADSTTVTVVKGEGKVIGSDGAWITLGTGVVARYSGTNLQEDLAATNLRHDGFDNWMAERDRHEDSATSLRYVSREVIGYEDLDDYGSWRVVSGYGPVWTPRVVVANWAPYRYGHWAWVAPWGWTWIDEARWGFAPFHYGRWAYIDSGWCWVPGQIYTRPVYSPALVTFVGAGSHWSVSLGIGGPGVAWFPLAPGEVYRPAYQVSTRYVAQINHSINLTLINNTVSQPVYINQRLPNAVTAVPTTAFVGGRPVGQAVTAINAASLASLRPVASANLPPVQQSLLSGARPAPNATSYANLRPVVATRPAIQPAAMNDQLARQFASQSGQVAGSLPTHISKPQAVGNAVAAPVPVLVAPRSPNATAIGGGAPNAVVNGGAAPNMIQRSAVPSSNAVQSSGAPQPPATLPINRNPVAASPAPNLGGALDRARTPAGNAVNQRDNAAVIERRADQAPVLQPPIQQANPATVAPSANAPQAVAPVRERPPVTSIQAPHRADVDRRESIQREPANNVPHPPQAVAAPRPAVNAVVESRPSEPARHEAVAVPHEPAHESRAAGERANLVNHARESAPAPKAEHPEHPREPKQEKKESHRDNRD